MAAKRGNDGELLTDCETLEARIRELEEARDHWHRRCDTFEDIIKERNAIIKKLEAREKELHEALGAADEPLDRIQNRSYLLSRTATEITKEDMQAMKRDADEVRAKIAAAKGV